MHYLQKLYFKLGFGTDEPFIGGQSYSGVDYYVTIDFLVKTLLSVTTIPYVSDSLKSHSK